MNKRKLLIVAVIICISFFALSRNNRLASFLQRYSPLQLLSQSFQGLFSTTVLGTIDDVEARRVIGVIKDRCGIDLAQYIDIQKDLTLSFPSYKIEGSQVTYNGDKYNNTALYAVARISEDLLDAKMIWPSDDGIFCKNSPTDEQIKASLSTYTKEWKPNHYIMDFFNVPGSKNEQMWFSWHHLPTSGGSQLYWLSDTFKGVAKANPHLAPFVYRKDQAPIDDYTKFDVTHPDVPKIIYDKWASRSNPNFGNDKVVNLFELDGTGFDQLIYKFPMPEGLNPHEQDTFRYTIRQAKSIREAGNSARYLGSEYLSKWQPGAVTYSITQEFINKLPTWLPFYNERVVLTPFYIEGYKNIEKYFHQQGKTNVRFMIYAYSAYYHMPPDLQVDLSNFDVYYVSPGAGTWNRAAMEADLANWQRWERTGANMIWRPNLWFANPFDPNLIFNLHNEFVTRAKPDGFYITGYTPGSVDGVQGVNRYTMFRTLQGRTPQQALDDYISAFDPVNQPVIRQYLSTAEDVVTSKQQFSNNKLNQMKAILDQGNNDSMMQQFKKGVEITLKKNDYSNQLISKTEFVDWFKAEAEKLPGLGNWGRFNISASNLVLGPIPETEDPILPIDPIDPILPVGGPAPTTIPTLGNTIIGGVSTGNKLILSSSITNTGGLPIFQTGFDYGFSPSYGNSLPETGSFGTGSFSLELNNIICGTTYYVRSFAMNSNGIAYGPGSSAQTAPCPEIKDDTLKNEPKKEDLLPKEPLPKTPEKVPDVAATKTVIDNPIKKSEPAPVEKKQEVVSIVQKKEPIVTPSIMVFIPKGEQPPSEEVLPPAIENTQEDDLTLEELLKKAKEALQLVLLFYR